MPTPALTLTSIDPTTVVVDANIRRNVKKDPTFWSVIKHDGVLDPIRVEQHDDGTFHLIDGQRRLLAAIDAGHTEVPALVRQRTKDRIEHITEQYNLNKQREEISAADEAGAIEELFDLGVSAGGIQKRLRAKKEIVEAVATVRQSEASRELVEIGIDLVTAAALTEFEDHPDLYEDLVQRASQFPAQARHYIEGARDELRRRTVKQTLIDELVNAGYTPHADDHVSYRDTHSGAIVELQDVYTDEKLTTPLIDAEIADEVLTYRPPRDLPGIVFTVNYDWDENQQIYYYPEWYMIAPLEHGYFAHILVSATPTSTAMNIDDDEAKAAASAERKRVIANNKAWPAATTVRREWITELLHRKTLPADAITFIAWTLAGGYPNVSTETGVALAAEWLSIRFNGYWDNDYEATLEDSTTRAAHVALAIAIAKSETLLKPKDYWRVGGKPLARYLRALAAWGYTLSDIEQELVDQASQ